MRFSFSNQHLIVRSGDRVSQHRFPQGKFIAYGLLCVVLIYLAFHMNVRTLLVQSAVELDSRKALSAVHLASQGVVADAKNVVAVTRVPRESELPTFRMTVPNNTLLEMQRALIVGDEKLGHGEGGTKPYFKALLEMDDCSSEIKVCLRGSMFWHHRPEKPSFRIKLKKADVEQGDRYIELTTPEDSLNIKNWLPMQLGEDLRLMADDSHPVRLFVNEKYFGVYMRSARQGEPFALANERMPGTFFKAEFCPDMWLKAEAWKLFGQQDPADVIVFQQFLDLLALPPTAENIERFEEIFDAEMFARWAALMSVIGSVHTDNIHNHSYFICSNQGKIEPLPWDCNGYGIHTDSTPPVDLEIQPVLRHLNADPRWVHRRNQLIYELINGSGSKLAVRKRCDAFLMKILPDLEADQNLGEITNVSGVGWQWISTSVADFDKLREELVAWIHARNRFLEKYLNDAKFAVVESGGYDSNQVRVLVFGSTAVKVTNVVSGESRVLFPGLSNECSIYTSHQKHGTSEYPFLKPTMMAYQLDASREQLTFSNAITGESLFDSPLPHPESEFAPARTIAPDQFSRELTSDVVLGPGEVTLEKDLIVGRYQKLIVRAGTQLNLGAGVGLYSRGLTRFEGTADQPITIRRYDSELWAAIGIAGENTAGSIFEFVDVAGGSTGKLDELRFKGMLNAYRCPDITLRNCTIGRNFVGDDAVNLAESNVRVEKCLWRDSKADALDLDMCKGTVTNCRWLNSGNDGLDLMSCVLKVSDCYFEGSGDKGISVGENTRLDANRVKIVGCLVGSEVKDDSVAQYTHCVFEGCGVGVHSYQKKWFYSGGGRTALVSCKVSGSETHDVEMKSKCSIILVDTTLNDSKNAGKGPKNQARIKNLNSLPPSWHTLMQPKKFQAH